MQSAKGFWAGCTVYIPIQQPRSGLHVIPGGVPYLPGTKIANGPKCSTWGETHVFFPTITLSFGFLTLPLFHGLKRNFCPGRGGCVPATPFPGTPQSCRGGSTRCPKISILRWHWSRLGKGQERARSCIHVEYIPKLCGICLVLAQTLGSPFVWASFFRQFSCPAYPSTYGAQCCYLQPAHPPLACLLKTTVATTSWRPGGGGG